MSNDPLVQSGFSRLWIITNPGPAGSLVYLGCAKIGDPSWPLGDVTRVECPDPNQYGAFIEQAKIRGARGRVSVPIMARYDFGYSTLLEIARQGCDFDLHALLGDCVTPSDYRSGWKKMIQFPGGLLTQYAIENLGAIESGEANPTNENVDASAKELYELVRSSFTELLASTVARELVSVDVCDSVNCGDCGAPSDGCSNVFTVMVGTGATPGTLPSVIASDDGGSTATTTNIDTMFSNETPEDSECIGDLFVVIASTSNSLHYADAAVLLGNAAPLGSTWTEVTSGFNNVSPYAIYSADSTHTWIVGNSGYIWFTDDPAAGVTAQSSGGVTVQALRDVHACDTDNVVAVGDNNAVLYTTNGGDTWASVTGPSVGVSLRAVWVVSPTVWMVGNAAGALYYTTNSGYSWVQITLPGSLTAIYDIQSPNGTVFYLGGESGGTGRILKSTAYGISGTWYVMPENKGALMDNDRINSLAVCNEKPGTVYGVGLGSNASDGFFVKAA